MILTRDIKLCVLVCVFIYVSFVSAHVSAQVYIHGCVQVCEPEDNLGYHFYYSLASVS